MQCFRANYPKLSNNILTSYSKKSNTKSGSIFSFQNLIFGRQSDKKLNLVGLGLAKRFGFGPNGISNNRSNGVKSNDVVIRKSVDFEKRERVVEGNALSQNVALNNITRIFTELLTERDQALQESEELELERNKISTELQKVEDAIRALNKQSQGLRAVLKSLVEKETSVNTILEDLDNRISSIAQETQSFEGRMRGIKGSSLPKSILYLENDQPKDIRSLVMTLIGHKDSVVTVSADHQFGTLVSGSLDKCARVWDLTDGICTAELSGHTSFINCSGIFKNVAATGSNDTFVKLWNLSQIPPPNEGKKKPFIIKGDFTKDYDDVDVIRADGGVLKGHTSGVTSLWFEDNVLCSGSTDNTIRHWDVQTGRCLNILRSESFVERESEMGKVDLIIYGGESNKEDVKTLKQLDLFVPGEDLGLWKGEENSVKRRLSIFDDIQSTGVQQKNQNKGVRIFNVGGRVGALQFWHHALAGGYGDGLVRLFDLRTGECNRVFPGPNSGGHSDGITSLKFDENFIVTGSTDKTVKIWDLRTNTVLDTIQFDHEVTSVSFDHRNIMIAAGTKEVKIYNRTSCLISGLGEEIDGGWSGHAKKVKYVYSIGDRVISGGSDSTVKVWNGP
ncbi:Mitochondrial fission protein [Clydaea vesicula]|uniref:Mitochondrial fission protein n=1 Tax=Clydaea vesicula TaxID=447962 RepID=A0AAD5TZT2_9FUNG|nr:Mitochondrial fission protein [Clydaea vesicula]